MSFRRSVLLLALLGATARAWSAGPPTLQTCGAPGSCGQSCACPVGWQCGDLAEQTVCFPDGVCRRGSPSCGVQQQSDVQLHGQGAASDRLPCNCMAVHEPVSCGGQTTLLITAGGKATSQ